MRHPNSNQSRLSSSPWRTRLLLLCAASLIGAANISQAGEDHDRARRALEAGEVLPLGTILERIAREHPGQVLDVELEPEKEGRTERWVYEIKLLRKGGTLVKLKVDARNGSVLSRKIKD